MRELLSSTKAHVYCLVRAQSNEAAAQRLQEALKKFYLEVDLSRVTTFAGDCSKPQFGLFTDDYEDLSARIAMIYHSAAEVNHALPYSSLRTSNVVATQEVLKFAASSNKTLNYVSTIGTIEFNNSRVQLEPGMVARLGGYNTTKIVSEQILTRARANGIFINIFRPGEHATKRANRTIN